MSKIILEVPVFTLEAALLAAEFGADRLELCAAFGEGGTTPSAGMLAHLKSKVDIPVYVMIRPRGGDFVYSDNELEVMQQDIDMLKSLGADGFVFGILEKDGRVNKAACVALREGTAGLPCTFHRAIDASVDLKGTLETVIECGFERILTSGGMNTVTDGLETIKELMKIAKERIIIMPGGGMAPSHVHKLSETGYLKEVHSSCKSYRTSYSNFFNPNLKLSEGGGLDNKVLTLDRKIFEAFQEELKNYNG